MYKFSSDPLKVYNEKFFGLSLRKGPTIWSCQQAPPSEPIVFSYSEKTVSISVIK